MAMLQLKLLLALQLAGLSWGQYKTWHTIDEEMVICPVLTKPTGAPSDLYWPTEQMYQVIINTSATAAAASGMDRDKVHVVSFIRDSSKTASVTITYEVSDGDGTEIIPLTDVTLDATSAVSTANAQGRCNCTGDNGQIGNDPRSFPTNYGKSCSTWDSDLTNCNTWYSGTNDKCCLPWCYADPTCPDAMESSVNYGAYYSYSAACGTTPAANCVQTTTTTTYPCACINVSSQFFNWSAVDDDKWGVGYGSYCQRWDEENCANGNYPTAQLDTWCCENWCYVNSTCSARIASFFKPGLFWAKASSMELKKPAPNNHQRCYSNTSIMNQCPFKAMPMQAVPDNTYCACMGYMPPAFTSGRRRTISYPANYGAQCGAHDLTGCSQHFNGAQTGIYCCQSWCYVDAECPTGNPSVLASGWFWSYKACADDGTLLRTCSYSSVCQPTGDNTGAVTQFTSSYPSTTPALTSTYGTSCSNWDETNCVAWWGSTSDWSSANSGNNWCCKSWAYVAEGCPGSIEGLAGLAYSYAICADLPSTAQNNRSWTGTSCSASGGRRLEETSEDAPLLPAPSLRGVGTANGRSEEEPKEEPDDDEDEEDEEDREHEEEDDEDEEHEEEEDERSEKSGERPREEIELDEEEDGKDDRLTDKEACIDTDDGLKDILGDDCDVYTENPSMCAAKYYDTIEFKAATLCCACGGGTLDFDEEDESMEGEGDVGARRLPGSRRRGGSSYSSARRRSPPAPRRRTPSTPRRRASPPRRRQVYAGSQRRREPTRVSQSGRRRTPAGGSSVGTTSARRRAGQLSSTGPRRRAAPVSSPRRRAPVPANTPGAGRRRTVASSSSSASAPRRRAAQASTQEGRRRVVSDDRRRATPGGTSANVRRRATGVGGRVYDTGRRRAAASSSSSSSSSGSTSSPRRRAAASTAYAHRRRRSSASTASSPTPSSSPRRRAAAPIYTSPSPPPYNDVAGHRRRRTPSSSPRRRSEPYGYTSSNQLQTNYGGHTPVKSSYGYTGNAQSSNTAQNVMMAGAAVAGAGVLAFGAYYAYNRYTQGGMTASSSGVDTEWCRVPDYVNGQAQAQAGKLIQCRDCTSAWGSGTCRNEDPCYSGGGCNFVLPQNTYRDDLMGSGFIPSTYKSPIKITIRQIVGSDFLAANVCPGDTPNITDVSVFVANSVVAPDLFVTLAEQSFLQSPSCDTDTRQQCTSSTSCTGFTHATCTTNGDVSTCECSEGYCYNQGTFVCERNPLGTSSAPGQFLSPWLLLLALCVSLRALKRWM